MRRRRKARVPPSSDFDFKKNAKLNAASFAKTKEAAGTKRVIMSSYARAVRVFLSSTFRDFSEERDLLVRKVFPSLRARLKERFVELVDVDLRWGITAEQAERGEVLPICLAEIDRARPFFVGMLGERYGWIPPADAYAPDLLERQPWLEDHRGGRSVTELEILHGVLNNPAMAGRAYFYFRSPAYAEAKDGDYVTAAPEDAARQVDLKDRIRRSGFPVVEDYSNPQAFAERLEADLWQVLDAAYPADEVPDAFERESRRHEAYALPRRRLYFGGERYIARLNELTESGAQRILIEGQSGGGKSALLANWIEAYRPAHPEAIVQAHYLSASADAADPAALVRRLCEAIKRMTASDEEIPGDSQKLFESLPLWLAKASAWAVKEDSRWIFVIDALNGLSDLRDLRWFPEFLPERVSFVVSCLPGAVMDALVTRGEWSRLQVEPLGDAGRRELLRLYLGLYNKTLPEDLEAKALGHELAFNPLFLRTLAEELRVFGVHEQLAERLDACLQSRTVDDLFELVLERVEGDCGAESVRSAMEAIWASRAGLTEEEILGMASLVPATWAPIRYALDEALLESGGRLTFTHDYMRIAVSDRYLEGNGSLANEGQSEAALASRRRLHERLAQWFEQQPTDARAAEETPYQWRAAEDWGRLKACLTRRQMFAALYEKRSNEEILSYWLALEARADADIERDYEVAWESWQLVEMAESTGRLASNLQQILSFAGGRCGAFTVRLAKLALALAENKLGPDHPDTSAYLSNLGSLLQDRGEYDAAEPLFRRALAIAEKVEGPQHSSTGVSLANLASLLRAKGDYDAAEPLLRRSLKITENAEGARHPMVGMMLDNLALLLKDKGDYDGAEALYRRADEIFEISVGPHHPDTGVHLNNLAALLKDKGDYDAAEPLLRRALAIAETVLGPRHPSTSNRLGNLAILLQAKGDYDGAEPLSRRALAISDDVLGSEHPEMATRVNNLAGLLRDGGDYNAAEPLYRRALTISEKTLGPEHPNTGTVLKNLVDLLGDMGKYDAAEPLCRRALAIAEEKLGPDHPTTADCLVNLGVLLFHRTDFAGAAKVLRDALPVYERVFGLNHLNTATVQSKLAGCLAAEHNYASAEPLFRRALTTAEGQLGRKHKFTNSLSTWLTDVLNALGRNPDPNVLLSRGDFISVTGFAKAVASKASVSELTSLHFLAGAYIAVRQDQIWGEDIGKLLKPKTDRAAQAALAAIGVDISGPLDPVHEKMPVSQDLKRIIGANARTSISALMDELADHAFGSDSSYVQII